MSWRKCLVLCTKGIRSVCAYVRGKNGLGEIDRAEHSLRCIPRTFDAFLRDLMHACIFAIPSVTRVARVRCISLARKMSLLEIVASRYSRYKLYKLDEIFTSRYFRIVPLHVTERWNQYQWLNGIFCTIIISSFDNVYFNIYILFNLI